MAKQDPCLTLSYERGQKINKNTYGLVVGKTFTFSGKDEHNYM